MNTMLTFDPTDPADGGMARQALDAIDVAFPAVDMGDDYKPSDH